MVQATQLERAGASAVTPNHSAWEVLTRSSIYAWAFLDDAHEAGFSPREETLTETILVEMSRRGSGNVRCLKIGQKEETRAGADFAMAVQTRQGLWMNALVQAKKLDQATGAYLELSKASAMEQSERLIAEAHARSAVPLYVFYNGSAMAESGRIIHLGGCEQGHLLRATDGPPWWGAHTPAGCTAVHASTLEQILQARPRPITPRTLGPVSLPWECLLCPLEDAAGSRDVKLAMTGRNGWPADDTFSWVSEVAPAWAMQVVRGATSASFQDLGFDTVPRVDFLIVLREGR